MKKECSFKIHIDTDTSIICECVQKILFFLQKHIVIPEDEIFEVKVILNELLINAMIHGNGNQPFKKVHVEVCICNDHTIYMVVEDEGEGVCGKGIKKMSDDSQCEEEAFQLDEHGRGLKIVSSLCSNIERNEKGNRVTVVKEFKHEIE